jgi:4-hydroxy-4-methyl-2-oxoglutarate aldolase
MNDYPAEFRSMSTATISDALDRVGVSTSLLGLRPLTFGQRLVGRAFTVRYVAAGTKPGTVGDYIDDVPEDHVVVLDNGGRLDCTVWGDILTAVASARHLGGTVIDGVCRDVARALSIGYPIYSRGHFMRTGKDRVEVSDVGTPVTIAAAKVRPGDLLVGDDDGVVLVPREHETRVLELALEISEREEAILRDALGGIPLREARAKHGYHHLQRPER